MVISLPLLSLREVIGFERTCHHWISRHQPRRLTATVESLSGYDDDVPYGDTAGAALVIENALVSRGSEDILSGVSWRVMPMERWAIVGPNGAGKSTLCRLLVGIQSPTKGSIFLDSVPIDKWDKNSVGVHIGYSPQEHQLFEDNISANIARYDGVDRDKLKKACELIGLNEQYENFSKNKELKVSTDGNNLPGGLKQKISLARAFYGSPKLLVLDEPTSMLDSESKELFINAINSKESSEKSN